MVETYKRVADDDVVQKVVSSNLKAQGSAHLKEPLLVAHGELHVAERRRAQQLSSDQLSRAQPVDEVAQPAATAVRGPRPAQPRRPSAAPPRIITSSRVLHVSALQ